MTAARTVTSLLRDWRNGDAAALDSLLPVVETELRRMARVHMKRERKEHTLQPTALVNEVFMRLLHGSSIEWNDRAHFFGICGRLMRRVLIDHARARSYEKRGGGVVRVTIDEQSLAGPADLDLMDLDRALMQLENLDARKCRVVEMRFFAGLSVEETADALSVSTDTVKRDWRIAKLWLLKELQA